MAVTQRRTLRAGRVGRPLLRQTYVHRITTEQFVRVLRTISELHAAGRPFNRTNLI
jgi:hypothetical protein